MTKKEEFKPGFISEIQRKKNYFCVIFRYVQIQSELENIHVDHIFKFRTKSFVSVDCRDDSGIISPWYLAFAIITSRQSSDIDATVSMVLINGTLVYAKLLLS